MNWINRAIAMLLSPCHSFLLPSFTGTYFVTPSIPYRSQFIGIYPASIQPDKLLTNSNHQKIFGAKNQQEFTFWAWRDCGIACIEMILRSLNKTKGKSMMDHTCPCQTRRTVDICL